MIWNKQKYDHRINIVEYINKLTYIKRDIKNKCWNVYHMN